MTSAAAIAPSLSERSSPSPAPRRQGSPRRTSRRRRWCRPAARSARPGSRRAAPPSIAIAPCLAAGDDRGRHPRRDRGDCRRPVAPPVSASASASLANKMSIAPLIEQVLRSSRCRSTTEAVGQSEGDPGAGRARAAIALSHRQPRRLGIPQIALEVEDFRIARPRPVDRVGRRAFGPRRDRCSWSAGHRG